MRIECVGLPGVGKTALIRAQRESLSEIFEIIDSRKSHVLNGLIMRFLFHGWLRWVLDDRRLASKLAYRMSFRIFSGFKNRPVFFFDAGLAQVVLENLIESNFKDQEQKINFLAKAPLRTDVLLYIYDDLDAILEREAGRAQPRFSLGRAELCTRYGKALDLLENRLLRSARRVYKVKSNSPIDMQDLLRNEEISKSSL